MRAETSRLVTIPLRSHFHPTAQFKEPFRGSGRMAGGGRAVAGAGAGQAQQAESVRLWGSDFGVSWQTSDAPPRALVAVEYLPCHTSSASSGTSSWAFRLAPAPQRLSALGGRRGAPSARPGTPGAGRSPSLRRLRPRSPDAQDSGCLLVPSRHPRPRARGPGLRRLLAALLPEPAPTVVMLRALRLRSGRKERSLCSQPTSSHLPRCPTRPGPAQPRPTRTGWREDLASQRPWPWGLGWRWLHPRFLASAG